ncbi:MAG: AAA family ATPase [Limisphaerales bacterium]
MRQTIKNYIRAGYSGLYLVSHEEQRVEAEIKAIAAELKCTLYAWSITEGLVNLDKASVTNCHDAVDTIEAIAGLEKESIILLRDYHLFFDDPNPVLLRALKDELQASRTKSKTIIVLGCRLVLPPELEREFAVIDFALPGEDVLTGVLNGIAESAGVAKADDVAREALVNAAKGMTTLEAENAYALSVVETGQLNAEVVATAKAHAIKKNGLLEIIKTTESLDSVGGLDLLKSWLLQRKDAFSKRAIEYGLPTPKGVLILGIPGTGKSLTAKATAKVFGMPLLKLDAGRIFAGLVGQSESNLRSVIQTAEAIAPCCLWIDELEKGFAGSKSSGATDGGTSARVFGSFISWMQEKKTSVFIVATANDVSQLPPEMLRKGRFDELWFVDLPNQTEREAIWKIQIAKHGRDPKDFDIVQLARASEGLTGSEIENVFVDAMYNAFAVSKEPTDLTIAHVLTEFVPLSKMMAEQINGLKNWVNGRARVATSQPVERALRRIAA